MFEEIFYYKKQKARQIESRKLEELEAMQGERKI